MSIYWLRPFLILVVTFLYVTNVVAQGVAINNIVKEDFTASKEDIIEIGFKDHLPNIPFVLAWIDASGKQYALPFKTSKESLIFPIGTQPEWKGEIGLLGLSINNVDVTIRKADMADAWKSFLRVHPLSPGSVNFSGTYFLLGVPFRWICAGIMLFIFGVVLMRSKRWDLALLLGFVVAWGAYDLRSGYNRWEVLDGISNNEWQIETLRELQAFIPMAREVIGPEGSWTKEPLSGFLNSYCTYELADLTYYPPKSKLKKDAEFIITTKPRKRTVILREGSYYLVQKRK